MLSVTKPTENKKEMKYRVAAEYEPAHEDEIALVVGDIVYVLHAYDDGWCLGKNETSKAVGLLPKNFLVPLSQVLSATAHVAAAGGIQDEHSLSSPLTTKPSVRTSSFISESGKGFEELKGADKRYSWGLLDELTNVNQKRNSLAGTNTKENPDKYSTLTKSKLSNAVSSNSERRGDDDDDARTITGTGGGQPIARLNAKAKLSTLTRWKSSRAPVSPNIGTLKIAVIGDTHIGKTSLIQSLLSIPEVVESDNITQLTSSSSTGSNIVEYKASTVPSEVSYAGEERFNLTFVDSPGYGKQTDAALVIRPIVEYHLNQFQKTDQIFVKGAASSQLMRFFNSGSGSHTHIDVCIYGILHRLKPVDVEYMRVLSPYTCIVPVILKSDSLRPTEIFDLKVSILETLMKTGISFYGFGLNMNELLELAKSQVMDAPPYAVSSPCVGKSCKFEGKEVVNEFETLKTNLLYNFTGDLRQAGSEKFVGWRQSRLNK